eukprot:365486-Chlamydomonas_euryale.AAC.17
MSISPRWRHVLFSTYVQVHETFVLNWMDGWKDGGLSGRADAVRSGDDTRRARFLTSTGVGFEA